MKKFSYIILLIFLITACVQEPSFLNEENEDIEQSYLNPELQPFAAWVRTNTFNTRSSYNSEINDLINIEKNEFDNKFAYIRVYSE